MYPAYQLHRDLHLRTLKIVKVFLSFQYHLIVALKRHESQHMPRYA